MEFCFKLYSARFIIKWTVIRCIIIGISTSLKHFFVRWCPKMRNFDVTHTKSRNIAVSFLFHGILFQVIHCQIHNLMGCHSMYHNVDYFIMWYSGNQKKLNFKEKLRFYQNSALLWHLKTLINFPQKLHFYYTCHKTTFPHYYILKFTFSFFSTHPIVHVFQTNFIDLLC